MNPPKTKGIVTFYSQDNTSTVSELAFSYDMVIVPNDGEGVPELVFYVNAIHIYFEPRI